MTPKKNFPPHWVVAQVQDVVVAIDYGHTASAKDSQDGPRFLRITDIQGGRVNWQTVPSCDLTTEELERYRLADGDLVFARTGATTGKSFLVRKCPEHAVFASYLIRLRASAMLNPEYLAYCFQTPDYWRQISQTATGTAQPGVNATKLNELCLLLAPAEEQRRIVAAIDSYATRLDDAMQTLERVDRNLKRYRASVLKSAVAGRLVPTEAALAKQEGRDYEPASVLLERVLTERRRRWAASGKKGEYREHAPLDTSNLHCLPEGWCWATTGLVCDCIVPNRDKPKTFTGDIPWVTLPDLEGQIEVHQSLSGLGLTEGEVGENAAKVIPTGSVVMSCVGRFGLTSVVGRPCVVNQQLHAFLPSSAVLPKYLAYALRTQTAWMQRTATATTIAYLNKDNCNSVPLALPPLAEQSRIVAEIERLLSECDAFEGVVDRGLHRGSRLRQSILNWAFEGKLADQDPSDEPASVLLARIKAERQKTQPAKKKSRA